jgi:hypothetical protein
MSQAKKNLGCIPGRLKALRAAAEILNIRTLSLSSTNGREKMKWIRLPHQENTELMWASQSCSYPKPRQGKENISSKQAKCAMVPKTETKMSHPWGGWQVLHIHEAAHFLMWFYQILDSTMGCRTVWTMSSLLVPVGLHQRINNGCWWQLKGNGDGHGHAMGWAPEPPPPLTRAQAWAFRSSWVLESFRIEGSGGGVWATLRHPPR